MHQVDASSDAPPVARANEKTSTGEFSKGGSPTMGYETVCCFSASHRVISCTHVACFQVSQHDQPYGTPSAHAGEAGEKLGYGGTSRKSETSKPDEGSEGKNAGGRKPEGRS